MAVAIVASLLLLPLAPDELPDPQGLVLWLDAADSATVARDDANRVGLWNDKSRQGLQAVQASTEHRPTYCADALAHQPVLRFSGNHYLNLGQPDCLDIQPGDPFTMVVVSNVAGDQLGTFISKGGGSAHQRSYQFYAAPGRIGTVTHGTMQEHHEPAGPRISVQRCDGSRATVHSNGQLALSFAPGKSTSDADVLVGARRKEVDNRGIFWALTGDIAEILVYDRALPQRELSSIVRYLERKYMIACGDIESDDLRHWMARGAANSIPFETVAEGLLRTGENGATELRALLAEEPASAISVAEVLLRIARKNQLSAAYAVLAGELVIHEDPFVCGLADWAITMKVGHENNGQSARWPVTEAPEWFLRWLQQDHDQLIENDWVRQAVSHQIHRHPQRMLASLEQLRQRAMRMRERFGTEGGKDPLWEPCLSRLESLRDALAKILHETPTDEPRSRQIWLSARRDMRRVVLDGSATDIEQIVFVKQFAPHTVRNITRSYSWKHKPGGDICLLDDIRSGRGPRNLLANRLGPGFVWGLDLWWDADRVVFGFAKQPNWPPTVDTTDSQVEGTHVFQLREQHEPVRLYEAQIDGSHLQPLTTDSYWSDFEPTYCANGDVVFASDRCGRSAECGNDTFDHTNPNLYVFARCDGEVRQLTDSKDLDRYPHSLDDGRIAYTHWEYQERYFLQVHSVWTTWPDGTMSDALFKQHLRAPYGMRDTRSIPDSHKLVSIATGHHTFAYGPVVVVDPGQGPNTVEGITIVTPGVVPQEGPMAGLAASEGGVSDRGGLYQTPWALNESCFLVSYAYARPNCSAPAGVDSNGFSIYLIDTFGNRELIHRDLLLSCTYPIPLRKRPRPPVLTPQSSLPAGDALCYVSDVYDGMNGVDRGSVKYLRIAQHIGWPFDQQHGQQDYIPGNAGTKRIDFQSWSPVRVLGTVPVEEDGSAYFQVPADTAVYFQALDENRMELVRMRSLVSMKAGEVRGCRGCHESQARTPMSVSRTPLAVKRAPSRPVPPPWGADRLMGYEWLVQPILERHCVACHGKDEPDGGLDLSGTRAADGLLQSYRTMFGVLPHQEERGPILVSCSDRFSDADVTKPRQFGSHKSRLVRVLLDDDLHKKEVRLTPAEWESLVTWIDANAPYHDTFRKKRPVGYTTQNIPSPPLPQGGRAAF